MKPFHAWIADMENSIVDESIVIKDEHGNIVLPVHKTFAEKYQDLYEKWDGRMDDPYYDDDY